MWRLVFNLAQSAVSLAAAHLVLVAFGRDATLAAPAVFEASTLAALVVAGAAWFATNSVLVGTLLALKVHCSPWHAITVGIDPRPLHDGAAVALAPLVVLAAERSPWLVPIMLIPLLAVYRSNVVSVALKHQEAHDALTGLPNRAHLLEQAQAAFAGLTAEGSVVGLFVLDLDRFQEINDSLGYHAGDRLLKVVGDRLGRVVRPGDLVAVSAVTNSRSCCLTWPTSGRLARWQLGSPAPSGPPFASRA